MFSQGSSPYVISGANRSVAAVAPAALGAISYIIGTPCCSTVLAYILLKHQVVSPVQINSAM